MYRKSILRIAVLTAIIATGLILIFFRDIDIDDFTMFCIAVIIAKALGIFLIGLSWALYRRWMDKDPLISKYERWIREAEEARL